MLNSNAHRGDLLCYFRCVNSSAGCCLTPLKYDMHLPEIHGYGYTTVDKICRGDITYVPLLFLYLHII